MILSDAGTPARKVTPGAGKSARITTSLLSTLMFLHKLRRTLIAMFWGWVVCNLVTLVFAVAIEWRRDLGSFSRAVGLPKALEGQRTPGRCRD